MCITSKNRKKRKSKKSYSDALTRDFSFRSPSARLFPIDRPNRKTKFPESFQNGRANARLRSARSARVLPENGIGTKDSGSPPASRRLAEPAIDRTSRNPFRVSSKAFFKTSFLGF
jgi:hypothetical protein